MSKLILHIPHASSIIPYYDGYIVSKEELKKEMNLLCDWFTDDLFSSSEEVIIKSDFSRVFCDVERFIDDKLEVMATKGMGLLYTHSDDEIVIRNIDQELRNRILNEFYFPHHNRLAEAVMNSLNLYGTAFIIDGHSFPDIPFKRDLDQRTPRPDFNIGTDDFHTPENLIKFAISFFREKGFSLGINWPYAGTIVPMEFYRKERQVFSIMLEVNRNLYLKNNSIEKSEKYSDIKNLIQEFIELAKEIMM